MIMSGGWCWNNCITSYAVQSTCFVLYLVGMLFVILLCWHVVILRTCYGMVWYHEYVYRSAKQKNTPFSMYLPKL